MKKIIKRTILTILLIVWILAISAADSTLEGWWFVLEMFLCVAPLAVIVWLGNKGWFWWYSMIMDKNVCISKGCPFYHCSSRPKFKNGIMDCSKKYICSKYCKEIKDVNRCEWYFLMGHLFVFGCSWWVAEYFLFGKEKNGLSIWTYRRR